MKLTLVQARNQLYDAVVPNLTSQENIARFNQYLNWAQERLINSGKWNGMHVPVIFTVPEDYHYITLPERFVSVLAMRYERTQDNMTSYAPVNIQNQWYSYLQQGPYCSDFTLWSNYGYAPFEVQSSDMGDGYVTFRNSPYDEYYLKFVLADAADADTDILVKGLDADRNPHFTNGDPSFDGVVTTVSFPSTTTSVTFTEDISFLSKPTTEGYVSLYAVDVDTAAETLIGYYQPSDQVPCYRRYFVGRIYNQVDRVRAICKLRYVPAVVDSDEVFPANLGALRLVLSALAYEKQSDFARYKTNFDEAIKLLNDEVRESRGAASLKMNVDAASYQFQTLYPGR